MMAIRLNLPNRLKSLGAALSFSVWGVSFLNGEENVCKMKKKSENSHAVFNATVAQRAKVRPKAPSI
jgi:hypothetical protein